MNKSDVYKVIDEILELDSGTINGNERLEELEDWDSLAVIGLIAVADEDFNISLSPGSIHSAVTTDDLAELFITEKV